MTGRLTEHVAYKNHAGDQQICGEECGDLSPEKLLDESPPIQPMGHQERDEEVVGHGQPDYSQNQIEMFPFHSPLYGRSQTPVLVRPRAEVVASGKKVDWRS